MAADVEEGLLCTGAQGYVALGGANVYDFALGTCGLGKPLERNSLIALYCNTKPLVALALCKLVAAGEIAVNQTLAHYLPEFHDSPLGATRVSELLTHTTGIVQPSAVSMAFLPPVDRHQIVLNLERRHKGGGGGAALQRVRQLARAGTSN